ncbi:serine/threonine protein kinase [Haloactinomyces albus]|uniref:non-specific serine/threonine protein kinase n=1 Tax=Haloactinomyces albus TaxID=1352928 RepID=A0AAE3ZE46_9ACTN|nr:serine/threonine-protein kinase [Haloactinomyces albus]MDR7301552.1 serine/threonine-protein kinase [Haloactinomyces albus]
MSEDLTGRRLGHYKIDEVLGRGGMSILYRATDVRLGRKVALKVMGEHITGDAEFRERFVDEARNTSAIDHANIVPLYDFGEVDGMLYIAMRLVDGSDLASLISEGPISPQRALDLLDQVGEALDMLHERGLVHLDLKPANVLVTSRESSHEHVYLADFGLTRRGATGHRTSSGDFLGSPTYAGPEHLRGEPVDGRTDLYALACMLFACLTGRPPFRGQVQEVIRGHLNVEPPTVTSHAALPAGIDEVLRCGMAKMPDQRYANCKEMITAARSALAQVPRSQASAASPHQGPLTGPEALAGSAPAGAVPNPPGYPGNPEHTGPPQQSPAAGPVAGGPYQPPQQSPYPPPQPFRTPQPPGPRPNPPGAVQPARFADGKSSSTRWVVSVMVIVAATVIVVLFIIMANSIGSGGADSGRTFGTSGESSYDNGPYNDGDLPTSVPTYGL